jgi:hypothetical protein
MTDTQWSSFDIDQFDRRLAISTFCRRALFWLLIIGWLGSIFEPLASTPLPMLCLIGAIVGWLVGNHISSRTARMALQTEQLAGAPVDPAAVEYQVRDALGKFTLYNTVRASLYHQLAMLRHRQGRLDDAANICFALLDANRLRLVPSVRTKVRLLLLDTSLQRGDVASAYPLLIALRSDRLELIELMQLLELQTRYQTMCGYHAQAVESLEHKVRLAEAMPAHAAAAMHQMLAHAAGACNMPATAKWLARRGDLLDAPAPAAPQPVDLALDT